MRVAHLSLDLGLGDEGRHLPEVTRSAVGEVAQLYAVRAARMREKIPQALRKLRGKRWKALEESMEEALSDLATEVLEEHVARGARRNKKWRF